MRFTDYWVGYCARLFLRCWVPDPISVMFQWTQLKTTCRHFNSTCNVLLFKKKVSNSYPFWKKNIQHKMLPNLKYSKIILYLFAGFARILFKLLRVPKGARNFDLTYLRAPWAVGIIIGYLSFSAIWYFLFKISWQNIHGEKSYRGWNYFSFELRCGHEVLLTIS